MAEHEHSEALISLVIHGNFVEQIGRTTRDYQRGHVAFFPAGMAHAQRFGPLGTREISFRPQDSWIDYLADSKIVLGHAPHANSAIFRQLGDSLLREIARNDDFSALACEGLLLEVIAALARSSRPDRVVGQPPAWLRNARDYIHDKARQPLTLAEIANHAGRHEVHLAREFSRHYGVSIGSYLRRLRAEHAAHLLRHSRQSLSEIALESGFSSHAHLCREFKAQLGATPSDYRRHASRTVR